MWAKVAPPAISALTFSHSSFVFTKICRALARAVAFMLIDVIQNREDRRIAGSVGGCKATGQCAKGPGGGQGSRYGTGELWRRNGVRPGLGISGQSASIESAVWPLIPNPGLTPTRRQLNASCGCRNPDFGAVPRWSSAAHRKASLSKRRPAK